jgi:hypothetical protein
MLLNGYKILRIWKCKDTAVVMIPSETATTLSMKIGLRRVCGVDSANRSTRRGIRIVPSIVVITMKTTAGRMAWANVAMMA